MDLQSIERAALRELEESHSLPEIDALYTRYLGRKEGQLTHVLRGLGALSADDKKKIGQAANHLKNLLEEKFQEKQKSLAASTLESQIQADFIDTSLPGYPFHRGKSHPIATTTIEISQIFREMGFDVVGGPDIESDFNNFTALNIPKNHPARDLHDTFYLNFPLGDHPDRSDDLSLLRTHTSPVQVRLMKSVRPPFRVIAPGRVYRHEAIDATHAAIFHQIEGLAVGPKISMADLKGTLVSFSKRFFGEGCPVRFRPSYFPFVEPGAEMDVACFLCRGKGSLDNDKGCSLCKTSGWIEMLGAGMVHPNVFRAVGYDPKKVTGFAFGMGIERIVMTRSGINDIRYFLESDLRFLEQF